MIKLSSKTYFLGTIFGSSKNLQKYSVASFRQRHSTWSVVKGRGFAEVWGEGSCDSRRGIPLQRGPPQAKFLKIRSSFSVLPLLRDKVEMGFRDNLPLVSDTQNCLSRHSLITVYTGRFLFETYHNITQLCEFQWRDFFFRVTKLFFRPQKKSPSPKKKYP